MANNSVKATKEQIKALNELRKSQGGLNLEQSKTLDNLREMLSELTGLEKRQKKLVDQGGTYTDLSKLWADNAMDQKKGAQELAKIQKGQLSLLSQAAKGELSAADIAQHRVNLEQQSSDIGKKYFGQNVETGKELQEQIKILLEHLKTVDELNATEQERNDKAAELEKNMGPLRKGWEDIKTKVGDFAKSLFSVKGIIGMITGGLIAAGGLLVKHFVGTFQAAMGMQKELGVGVGHAMDLQIATNEAAMGGFMYGESVEDVAGRASTLVEEWGVINEETKNSIAAATELERHYGVSTTAAANIAQMMESTSGSTKDVLLQDMGKEMKKMQKSGVPVGKIMEEVAGDTDFFAGSMKKGGKNVLKAAAFAKKLGMSMETVSGAADSLLDWDTSINAEMEASVLLGRNINMNRARELAYVGDLEGMQKEIMKQVGSEAEFAEMSRVQREALADAAGLSLTDLSKMVAAEEKLANMDEKALEKQKENEAVTSNMQKIWGAITATLQKMYEKFITPLMEKMKKIMGVSADMSGEMEFGADQIEKLEAFLTPIFEKVVSIATTIGKWIYSLGLARDESGNIVGETFELGNVLKLVTVKIDAIKKKYAEIKEDAAKWWIENKKIVIGVGVLLVALKALPLVMAALNVVSAIWAGIMWLASLPFAPIILAVLAIVAAVGLLIYYWDEINAWVKKVSGGFVDMWDILLLIMGPIGWMIMAVKKIWENWDLVSAAISGVWEWVKSLFTGMTEWFGELWGGIKEKFATLGEWFGGIGEKIKSIFTGVKEFIGKVWDGLIAILKAPFNFIIDGINMMIRGINSISIDVPDWLPFGGGKSIGFSLPEIPSLQTALGEGHRVAAGGIAQVHTGESVGRFDMKDTNDKLDMVIRLLSGMPTTEQASVWARKQKSATEGAFANR